jgi:FtsH-binding integral membrane protein
VLLTLWDGLEAEHKGGTADVLHYHLTGMLARAGRREESPNLLAENENDLAYHIFCSRSGAPGALAPEMEPPAARWITAHFEPAPGGEMPIAYRQMLQRLVQFGQDKIRFNETIDRESHSLLSGQAWLAAPPSVKDVDRSFGAADWLAIHFRKRVSTGLLLTHIIAVLMGLAFIVYSEYDGLDWLVLVFLGLFFGGVALYMWSERRQWHRKYLDYRALAEGLRVQLYWLMSGVVDTSSIEFAYDNFLQKQDVDLGWIRHVMRSASLAQDREDHPDPAWVDWVIKHWVGGPGDPNGQLAYYQRNASLKETAFRRTELLGNASLWLGIVLAIVLYVAAGRLQQSQHQILLVLMGVLPLFAAIRSAYSHQKADKELIKQYRFMNRVFVNAHRLLDKTQDLETKKQILRALGNAALEEHAEWILMHRERPLEHGRL